MLDLIRQKKQSVIIKFVFAFIVLSFVGTIFVVWGKGDDGPGRTVNYAAKVDGTKISLDEYQHAYNQMKNMYLQLYGQSLPAEVEKTLGLKKAALDRLVDNLLVVKEAKRMGIVVEKDEITAEIAKMPVFKKDGVFSFDLYQRLLRENRITAQDFEKSITNELLTSKVRQSVLEKVSVGDDEALAHYKKMTEKLDLEYIQFAPAKLVAEVKVTDAELNDYLQRNQKDFMTPEKVALSYIILDPASQISRVKVTEEEIETHYNKNLDRWQGKDGSIPFKDVKDKVKADLIKQKASKQAFELAADTLYKNIKSADLNLIAGQLHLKVQELPLFSANAVPAEVAGEGALLKAAFGLKQGELGGPVETTKGIYLFKARERKAAAIPPLNDVRGAVELKYKLAKAADLAQKRAVEATVQLAAKTTMATQSTGSFGYSPKGDIPGIGVSPELIESAFRLTTASPAATSAFRVGSNWYAFRLKSRTEAPKGEFEKAKAQLKQILLPKKQQEALSVWLKGLRAKAKIEYNQALITDK